jgi:N-acetylmuramoyl-L-alanine amidase
VVLAAFAACAGAAAQVQLAVNGVAVPGATTTLVPGVTYAPAVDLAAALGAEVDADPISGRATFTLGAAVVQVELVSDAAQALARDPAITRDGARRPGSAGVHDGFEAFVPVKGVAEAFGGRVSFVQDSGVVVVVLPRPALSVRVDGSGLGERLVFRLDAPTRVTSYLNEATSVLELRFDRTDAEATALDGTAFVRASVASVRGAAEVRVQLVPDRTARVLTLPDGDGASVVVAFAAELEPLDLGAARGARLVLDAGHDPSDPGLVVDGVRETDVTRAFVDAVAEALAGSGIEVARTRPSSVAVSLAERSVLGVGADAFVSVHAAPLAAGRGRVYVLDDASGAAAMEMAVRRNAETALASPTTDAVRRALLLRLVADVDAGWRLAGALRTALGAAGLTLDPVEGAPLAVLEGAAGRGVLLELSPLDLADPSLPRSLAAALVAALTTP